MKNFSHLFVITLLILSAILPTGADAALCFEENNEIDIHFLECATEHQVSQHDEHPEETLSEIHNDCNDLKLLCSIETSLSSSEFLKVVSQKAPLVYVFFAIENSLQNSYLALKAKQVILFDDKLRPNPQLVHITSIQILV